jgi:hypothetical protein
MSSLNNAMWRQMVPIFHGCMREAIIVNHFEMPGMGFPETARPELMTPIASNAVGVCSTRRSAGFLVPANWHNEGRR